MSITYYGIEWDYNNLANIGYSSATLDEPYATWLYQITSATEKEKENSFNVSYTNQEKLVNKIRSENISFSEDKNSLVKSFISDNVELNLSDSKNLKVVFDNKENSINLSSDKGTDVGRYNVERLLKFNDSNRVKIINPYSENLISILDSYNQESISHYKENLTFNDSNSFIRLKSFYKESPFYIIDEGKFIATDEYGEQTIGEQIELGGSISLFDFEISSTPLNQSNFETWNADNCPINYNELRPFIPGEYEYKDAYAGFKLSISPTEGRFGVYGSTVYIDVEDTVEKGVAEATAGGLTRVEFSKRFYTSPHIISSLVYTTENCYIEIPTVTKEYFEFGLKSITSGLYLSGEISWLADGY